MPVGAGDGALGRIEAGLAAEDPALVESFHRWGACADDPDEGVVLVPGRTGLVLLIGLFVVMAGSTGVLAMLLVGGTAVACVVAVRWAERGPTPASGG